jgi:hypothetical protein
MGKRKLLTKRDAFFILGVLGLAALLWVFMRQDAAPVCLVRYNGETVKTMPLDEDAMFTVPEAPDMRFEIKNGKAAVTHSSCPDKTCVRTGFISKPGQAAVCLPNRIVLSIDNAAQDAQAPDMVTR